MKKSILAATAAGLMTFGMAAQAGDVAAGQAAYSTCMGCHGMQGQGGVGPAVAGRDAGELAELMKKYRAGEQVGPMTAMMAPMAAGLSDADIANLSAYMASL
ncbi:c-type cytochrome [Thiomicrospira sp. ALE5]|uniref:c-type cytochrome n=1 Tax=Thiomicrospira sp. ALE5 TaxID=748650 RepID=UPI0008EBE522|nr:c-type cytochrome [Thiomicrospira sp. ALE5]SFR63239.1 Cytochrome c553 [Thiomicrospira sp. ALE5]